LDELAKQNENRLIQLASLRKNIWIELTRSECNPIVAILFVVAETGRHGFVFLIHAH
jgi:hypothetical protein